MAERIYETDSHARTCTARVLSCTEAPGGYDLIMDRTAFFPEAGGQPCDLGMIGAVRVLHVRQSGDEIIHRCDHALPMGQEVCLSIDWARRFDYMQQHTGEHLLSHAADRLFGAHNIGFHLAEADYTTIDFDRPLSPEELQAAQCMANELIWRGLAVRADFYDSAEALAELPLRKQTEGLAPPIRVVSIEDADMCTCCAPHCRHSGEVGMLLITDAVAYKGGTRVFFVCGGRALDYAVRAHGALDGLARRFSCKRAEVCAHVDKLFSDYAEARRSERALTDTLNEHLAAALRVNAEQIGGKRLMLELYNGVDAARLKPIAQAALEPKALCVLLSITGGKLAYAAASAEGFTPDAEEIIQAVNAATGGKGGGRNGLAQGMAPSIAGTAETLEQLRRYFRQRLA